MEPITDIAEAIRRIEEYQGAPQDFELPISDSLNDEIGVNIAIVTDAILGKGWEPNGFVQKDGFRIYLYAPSE